MKEFADDNFKFDENGRKLSKRVENTVGKGEIAHYEQFLLFPQRFQKACFPGASKGVIVWEWVNYQHHNRNFTSNHRKQQNLQQKSTNTLEKYTKKIYNIDCSRPKLLHLHIIDHCKNVEKQISNYIYKCI